jgi:hypothetical protein
VLKVFLPFFHLRAHFQQNAVRWVLLPQDPVLTVVVGVMEACDYYRQQFFAILELRPVVSQMVIYHHRHHLPEVGVGVESFLIILEGL